MVLVSRRRRLWSTLGLTLTVATACGADSTETPADHLEVIRESCSELARAWCEGYASCRSATFAHAYGDAATCIERQGRACEGTRFAPGSRWTPQQVVACARAIDLSSLALEERCPKWLRWEVLRKWPEECLSMGTLPDGERCVDGVQCASGSCWGALPCGQCRQRAGLEEPCFQDSDCEPGLGCAGQRCTSYGVLGATCDATHPCLPELGCDGSKCVTRAAEGEKCKPGTDSCARWPVELACDPKTEACVPLTLSGYRTACNAVVLCESGLACRVELDPEAPQAGTESGSCVPAIEDGLVCAYGPYLFGGPCRAPSVCAGARCQFPDSASCSERLP